MKFVIKKDQILPKVQFVNSIVPVRNPLQILTNILFIVDAETNSIKLVSTDLEVSGVSEMSGEVEESGTIAVPAREITEIIRSLPEADIHFFTENNILKIKCLHIDYKLIFANPEDFPEIPERNWDNSFEIDSALFSRMILKTSFAVSREIGRPAFTGVLWELENETQRMVATDGRRLGKVETALSLDIAERKIIIPIKGLNLIKSIIEEKKPILKIIPEESGISFKYDSYKIFSRLIESKYPDYNAVIPYNNSKNVEVDREALINAVKRVALLATEDNYKIIFNFSKNHIVIHCEDIEKGAAKEVIETTAQIENFTIGFNYKYMLEILQLISSSKVLIKLENELDPALFFDTEHSEKITEKTLLLLMPLRIATD